MSRRSGAARKLKERLGMARRNEAVLSETETVIGAGVKVKGTLVSEGDISIDGELKGSIKAGGNLTIGVNGQIEANIAAKNIRIGGHLIGNVKAENETVVEGSARVKGNIHTSLLSIDQGAVFLGQSIMSDTRADTRDRTNEEKPHV